MKKLLVLLFGCLTLSVFAQNTGIGTTTPVARLEVKGAGSTSSTNNLLLRNSSNDTLLRVRDDGRMNLNYNGVQVGRTLQIGGNGLNLYNTDIDFGGAIFPTDTSLVIWSGSNANNYIILQPIWGNVGIGTYSPKAKFHVSKGTSGSTYFSSAGVVFEDNSDLFLQFATPSAEENGMLSSSELTTIRAGLIFRPDSSVQIRAGGNTTKFSVDKSGNTNAVGEIRRTPTGTANMVPICYGSVDANGTILSGSGNYSVTTTPPGYYEVTITGETYTNSGYATNASPINSSPRFLSTGNTGGKLVVRTWTSASVLVDTPFHFVVYKN